MNAFPQERRHALRTPFLPQGERRAAQPAGVTANPGVAAGDRPADDALVCKAQEGDRAAFDQLVRKYQGKLLRVLSRMTYDQADAQDIVQETFIRAYRALPSFRREASFYTWLFRIGINSARNHRMAKMLRADVSQQLVLEPDEAPDEGKAVPDDHSPVALLENKQTLMALSDVLDAMPAHLSGPLLLCELEGLSYLEIAQVMKCPIGTVRSRIFRARELIAARLAPMIDSALPSRGRS
jgi:RNA polymerase sigma-70 factor (ECF subfamily)